MLFTFMSFTKSVYGPPAFIAGSDISHSPLSLATVFTFLPLSAMKTFSLGSAQPHILISAFRCITILSENIFGKRTVAFATNADRSKAKERNAFFILKNN